MVKLLQVPTSISEHSVFNKFYSNAFFKSTRQKLHVSWNFPQRVKKQIKNIPYRIVVIISFELLWSSYFKFLRPFQILLILTIFIQMPFLNQQLRVTRFMAFIVIGKKIVKIFPLGF